MKEYRRPAFLDASTAMLCVQRAVKLVFDNFEPKRKHCHVVILAPQLVRETGGNYPWSYATQPFTLCESSEGKGNWEHKYDEIAQCKALQLWQGRNTGGAMLQTPATLMFPGDTVYWGGDIMEGVVGACSGIEPHFDQLIARVSLAQIVALAKKKQEAAPGEDFLKDRVSQTP